MEHVNDELLVEILCRLPNYRTAVRCKTVSKHWCSVISDPFFMAKGYSLNRGNKKREKPWPFYLTLEPLLEDYILSLNFLPKHPLMIVNTFHDLVLCFSYKRSTTEVGVFIICNPLTKHWIALPPLKTHIFPFVWAGLVWQDDGRDFRVIVLPYGRSSQRRHLLPEMELFRNYNLDIYISETGQWKNIDVKIPIRQYNNNERFGGLSVEVCKGMVCMLQSFYFGAFNPFDVTHGFCGPLRAIGLPLPRVGERLLESCGKLMVVNYSTVIRFPPNQNGPYYYPCYKLDVNFENDEQDCDKWKYVARVRESIKAPESIVAPWGRSNYRYDLLNVDPNKDSLVYFMARLPQGRGYQLIVHNTRLETFELLKQGPAHQFFGFIDLLNLSYWPMPISKED
ncbi:hypothetical protein vseg_014383 [Gypsophila vaccaria]